MTVISKGDDALLILNCRETWRFPCGEAILGRLHPIDGEWAIETGRSRLRRRLPRDAVDLDPVARALTEFAEHLMFHYPVVCDDEGCVIFALGLFNRLYGRNATQPLTTT